MSTAIPPVPTPGDDPLFNRPGAAKYISVQPQTLAVWASTGRYDLPFIKVGRAVRYRKSDLDAFLAANTSTRTS